MREWRVSEKHGFGSGRELSTSVVHAVARASEIPIADMPPLNAIVDTNALNRLFPDPPRVGETRCIITLRYCGCDVRVTDDGTILVSTPE